MAATKLRADFQHCFQGVVFLSVGLKNHAHAPGLLRQHYNRVKTELASGHIKEYLDNTKARCKA